MYHYDGNNPVKYVDSDGRETDPKNLPSLNSLEWNKQKRFEDAKNNLNINLDKMITSLRNYEEKNSLLKSIQNSADKWLKIEINSKNQASALATKLQDMKDTLSSLSSKDIKYDENLCDALAYVHTEGPRQIYGVSENKSAKTLVLGWEFMAIKIGNRTTSCADREEVLIHEMSHYCLGTEDNAYGYADSEKKNFSNADNWLFFYREIENAKDY